MSKKLYAQEAKYEDMKVYTIDGKKLESFDSVKLFQDKNWFN